MDINSDNDDSKDNNRDSNISHSNNTNDDVSSYHMYTLTPIECFVINKHLPFTLKLEHEDVYKAYLCKKQKQNEMIMSTYNNNNNSCGTGGVSVNGVCDKRKRKLKRKRKRKRDVEIDNESFDLSDSSNNNNNYNYYYANKKFPPLNRKVTKKMKISNQLKCEKVVYKLQRIPMSKYFFTACSVDNYLISRNMLPKKKINKNRKGGYNSNSNNGNNSNNTSIFHYLKKIYMKVQNKEYETIYHFGNDLRKTWDGLFRLYSNNPKLYMKIYTLSEKCEEWMNRMEGVSYSKLKKDNELSSEDEVCDIYSNNSCYRYDAVSNGNNINNTRYKFITHTVVDDVAAPQQHHQQQFMYNNNKRQLPHNNNNTLFRTTTYYQQQQQRTALFNVNDNKQRQQRLPVKPPTQEEKDFINTGIKHLSKDQLYEILKIIGGSVKQNNTGIYKFNIEDLEISEQRELYNYVSQCLHQQQQQRNNNSYNNIQHDITPAHEHYNPEHERLTDIDKVEQLKKDLGFYHSYNKYSTEIDNTYNLPKYDSYINNINTFNNNNNNSSLY